MITVLSCQVQNVTPNDCETVLFLELSLAVVSYRVEYIKTWKLIERGLEVKELRLGAGSR
jgi:hypothetical protein